MGGSGGMGGYGGLGPRSTEEVSLMSHHEGHELVGNIFEAAIALRHSGGKERRERLKHALGSWGVVRTETVDGSGQ